MHFGISGKASLHWKNTKMHKLASIIITNYNYGKFISRAIRSCLDQSIAEQTEVIVVDDASTDSSVPIINGFGDKIVTIFLDKNMGVSYCSNLGIKMAQGMFVMRVDADDYIHNKTVELLSTFLIMNESYSFAYSDHIRVDNNEAKHERISLNNLEALHDHGAGILFKKSHLEAIGLYDEEMKNCEDMLLIKRLGAAGYKGIHVQLPLYRYFRHDKNMTNDVAAREHWKKIVRVKIKDEDRTL